MSFVHHEPDLSRDPCPGCARAVAVEDMVRGENDFGLSCCSWYAYHRWCVLESVGKSWDVTRCAECDEAIPLDLLRVGLEAVAVRHSRAHQERSVPGILAWRRIPRDAPDRLRLRVPPELFPSACDDPREDYWRNRVLDYLPVHDACVVNLSGQSALRIREE